MTYDPHAPLWPYLRAAAPAARWVCWRIARDKHGRPVKLPVQPSMRPARVDTPHTWRTHDAVASTAHTRADVDGVGIVFTGDIDAVDGAALIGIEFDAVVVDGAYTHRPARDMVRRADTLTELSQSGTGVHLYARVIGGAHIDDGIGVGKARHTLAGAPHPRAAIELFTARAYFAATGRPLGDVRPVRTVSFDQLRDIIAIASPNMAARLRPGPPPTTTATRRRIPRAVWRAMTAAYASTSEREMAIIGALCNAGWPDAAVIAWVMHAPNDGRLHTPARLAGRHITTAQATATLTAAIAKHRKRGDRADVATARTDIAALTATIANMAPGTLTTRRGHETDRPVMLAVLGRMATAGTNTVAIGRRDIALTMGGGVLPQTVSRALARLVRAGWLTVTAPGTLTQAATYTLGDTAQRAVTEKRHLHVGLCVSGAFLSADVSHCVPHPADADVDVVTPPLITAIAAHRAIRAAASAWRAMAGVMLTPAELAAVLGVHLRTASRHIARLAAYGLIVTDGAAYTAVMRPDVIDAVAERLGIGARRDALAARIAAERDGLRAGRDRRAAAERAAAGRMLRARMGIGAVVDAPPPQESTVTHATNAPQGHGGPQNTPQAQTPTDGENGPLRAAPDATGTDAAVTVTIGDAALTTTVSGLAALASTPSADAGITRAAVALRAAGDAPTPSALASNLFGAAVAVAPPPPDIRPV